jgi:hypothetical protein
VYDARRDETLDRVSQRVLDVLLVVVVFVRRARRDVVDAGVFDEMRSNECTCRRCRWLDRVQSKSDKVPVEGVDGGASKSYSGITTIRE